MEKVPEEFQKIIKDFVNDLYNTFQDILTEEKYPLFHKILNTNTNTNTINDDDDNHDNHDNDEDSKTMNTNNEIFMELYNYCKTNYPERFFDILYQNNDIFEKEEINTYFLPNLDFKDLWKENISDNTKETIWKYLQLILFSIVTGIKNQDSFGDTAKLFEAINEDDFKNKIEETISQMGDLFNSNRENKSSNSESNDNSTNEKNNNIPNPEDIHKHITGMMDGKLGKLAKEIAEETAADLDFDLDSSGADMNSVIKQLFKDPTKIMSLVKNVGSKLDNKLKSGDIKESELLEEASELVNKMKSMPGMGNFEKMLGKMGMPSGGKVDMNAFQQHMQQNMKNAKMKERMRSKINENEENRDEKMNSERMKLEKEIENYKNNKEISDFLSSVGLNEDGKEGFVFKTGETVQRSSRSSVNKKKKKNSKK